MLKKVAFTYYPVKDMAAARAFYEGNLGLATDAGDSPWVEYDLPGGGCFVITNVVPAEPGAGGGTIAFEVEDLPGLVERLRGEGVRIGHSELIKGPHCRMMPVFDPDGNSVLLHQLD